MRACKSKLKVPKKPERIGTKKDVIGESFIALFHDDYRICEENLYTLFALKDEKSVLKIDLHNGKLYLFEGETATEAFYYNMPYYLKNGGKGAGKYKHLTESNWQRLTDREKARQLCDMHRPAPVEHTYVPRTAPPDFEAYYICVQSETERSCVYLREAGEGKWRVFYAKACDSAPLFTPYACSEKTLYDVLKGIDRRSKEGQMDCCDRLLGEEEMQYLCAFMPDEHAPKRSKGLALASTDDEKTVVNAYYWKHAKPICCADEDYILDLFGALKEIAACSVILAVSEENAEQDNSEQEAALEQVERRLRKVPLPKVKKPPP